MCCCVDVQLRRAGVLLPGTDLPLREWGAHDQQRGVPIRDAQACHRGQASTTVVVKPALSLILALVSQYILAVWE